MPVSHWLVFHNPVTDSVFFQIILWENFFQEWIVYAKQNQYVEDLLYMYKPVGHMRDNMEVFWASEKILALTTNLPHKWGANW